MLGGNFPTKQNIACKANEERSQGNMFYESVIMKLVSV